MPEQRPMSGVISRRREKPQLSCNSCRRRKVRCDRRHPCSNCSSRGQAHSCVFAAPPAYDANRDQTHASPATTGEPSPDILSGSVTDMHTRINHLESLVVGLMHQTTNSPYSSPTQNPPSMQVATPVSEARLVARPPRTHLTAVPASPSDCGSISMRGDRLSYVGSSHWAAVLDSIADLRTQFAKEEESHEYIPEQPLLSQPAYPKPELLYGRSMCETPTSILKSLPPRTVVDRLVSRYFNVLDIAPGIIHSGQFLREYEEFWKAPQNAPILWVGLLYSIMCLASQLRQASMGSQEQGRPTSGSEDAGKMYKTKATQCLMLGHYTKGGAYALETLVLYFLTECLDLKDMEIGIWVLCGTIVQVAIHMGYHRDPKHFPNITQFAGEMRRRAWALILQFDYTVSTQLGLPRLIKANQTDTAEPRNLEDSDFDESTTALPPSRPENKVTPMLYVLAKLRLLSIGGKVADFAIELHPQPHQDIIELDQQIDKAFDAIPPCLRWKGLRASLNLSAQTILQQIWLEVSIQQLKIVLHKRSLNASRHNPHYSSSRSACVSAAMRILDLQHLVDEETQPDGLLVALRWRVSSAFINDFLLATSVLCYYIKNYVEDGKAPSEMIEDNPGPIELEKIKENLRTSQGIWVRLCTNSKEARKAVAALHYVLSDEETRTEVHADDTFAATAPTAAAVSYFPDFTQNYDFLGAGFESGNQAMLWPAFAPNLHTDMEQWAGTGGFPQMDLTS